jgi:hypothetical protein
VIEWVYYKTGLGERRKDMNQNKTIKWRFVLTAAVLSLVLSAVLILAIYSPVLLGGPVDDPMIIETAFFPIIVVTTTGLVTLCIIALGAFGQHERGYEEWITYGVGNS